MVLVDTTVWIDFFGGRTEPHVVALEEFIEDDADLCLCGVILAEVLQGIRSDAEYRKTKDYLDALIFFRCGRSRSFAPPIYTVLSEKKASPSVNRSAA